MLRWLGQRITTGKLRGPLPIYDLHGEKNCALPRKFSTEAWGKIELFNIFPQVGKNMRGKDYERRPVQLGVSLLSLSPGDTPAS